MLHTVFEVKISPTSLISQSNH